MRLQLSLELLHKKVVSNPWLKLFTAITRGLLAIGFILPGLKKVANVPFAPGIPVEQPIGYFFDAFFQATEYYIFVGIAQVIAGILLLFPATTALGAFIYLPVILNIFVITTAMNFTGTWIISGLMLLATIYLLCWEFDRWSNLLPGFNKTTELIPDKQLGFIGTVLATGLTALTGFGGVFFLRGLVVEGQILIPLLIAIASGSAAAYMLFRYRNKYQKV